MNSLEDALNKMLAQRRKNLDQIQALKRANSDIDHELIRTLIQEMNPDSLPYFIKVDYSRLEREFLHY